MGVVYHKNEKLVHTKFCSEILNRINHLGVQTYMKE
jgi:hypothetical protein